ncbi:hypothetical protein [Streptomyces sp. NPDC058683]|uniref:hypothetical protein n=1 Tax=Streptomyces sp. NPDC058683 TaxID=3346597 RepID=UPI0036464CC5
MEQAGLTTACAADRWSTRNVNVLSFTSALLAFVLFSVAAADDICGAEGSGGLLPVPAT